MTPSTIDAMLDKYGETVTLKRSGVTDLDLKAKVRFFKPAELVGDIIQGDRQVTLSTGALAAASWPVPPKRGDQIVIGGATTTVQAPDSASIGDDVAKYTLQVRGS